MGATDSDMPMPGRSDWTMRGLRGMLEDYERQLILQALRDARGNQRRAAECLGVLPSTLCEKMKRLGIRSRVYYVDESESGDSTHTPL